MRKVLNLRDSSDKKRKLSLVSPFSWSFRLISRRTNSVISHVRADVFLYLGGSKNSWASQDLRAQGPDCCHHPSPSRRGLAVSLLAASSPWVLQGEPERPSWWHWPGIPLGTPQLLHLCVFLHISCFSTPRECVRKCSSSRVVSTSTWKNFLMAFTRGSCSFLMSVTLCPTTVMWYQVGQNSTGAPLKPTHHQFPFTAMLHRRDRPVLMAWREKPWKWVHRITVLAGAVEQQVPGQGTRRPALAPWLFWVPLGMQVPLKWP